FIVQLRNAAQLKAIAADREGEATAATWWHRVAALDPFDVRSAVEVFEAQFAAGDRAGAVTSAGRFLARTGRAISAEVREWIRRSALSSLAPVETAENAGARMQPDIRATEERVRLLGGDPATLVEPASGTGGQPVTPPKRSPRLRLWPTVAAGV